MIKKGQRFLKKNYEQITNQEIASILAGFSGHRQKRFSLVGSPFTSSAPRRPEAPASLARLAKQLLFNYLGPTSRTAAYGSSSVVVPRDD